jgi:tetratricopeptide (TPR) repeat protein
MTKIIRHLFSVVILTAALSVLGVAQTSNCSATDYPCKITGALKQIAANPNDIEAYYTLADAYWGSGKWTDAISAINKYIALKPSKPQYLADAYFLRGNANRDNKALELAIADYNTALSINPSMVNVYMNRGLVRYRQNDYVRAIADISKAGEIDPKESEVYYNRGLVYEKKGDAAKAIDDYTKYISMNSAEPAKLSDGYSRRGMVYLGLNDLGQALNDLSMAIRLAPEKALFYTQRATIYRKQGKMTLAVADEEKAAALK